MTLEEKFAETVKEWKVHCEKNAIYSMPEPYLNCEAYKKLAAMGTEILPLIRNEYSKEEGDNIRLSQRGIGIYWCYLIHDIILEFELKIGEKDSNSAIEKVALGFIGIQVNELKKQTIKWLDENMKKYTDA